MRSDDEVWAVAGSPQWLRAREVAGFWLWRNGYGAVNNRFLPLAARSMKRDYGWQVYTIV
jgi:hypothetical protein